VPPTINTRPWYEALIIKANGKNEVQLVTDRWVEDVFEPKFVEIVRRAAVLPSTKGMWVDVPVGSAQNDPNDKCPFHLLTKVKVKFNQGAAATCLYFSFASALHYLKDYSLANRVASGALKHCHLAGQSQFDYLVDLVTKHSTNYQVKKYLKKSRACGLDLLKDKSNSPTVVVPLGCDGGVEHAVTVSGDLVFDSTQDMALILSNETLNWICSTESGYSCVYMAVRFMVNEKSK